MEEGGGVLSLSPTEEQSAARGPDAERGPNGRGKRPRARAARARPARSTRGGGGGQWGRGAAPRASAGGRRAPVPYRMAGARRGARGGAPRAAARAPSGDGRSRVRSGDGARMQARISDEVNIRRGIRRISDEDAAAILESRPCSRLNGPRSAGHAGGAVGGARGLGSRRWGGGAE
jgi:hypothetical protein